MERGAHPVWLGSVAVVGLRWCARALVLGLAVAAVGCGGNGQGRGGVGASSPWMPNVTVHEAGPYRMCGEAGAGMIVAAAARPQSTEIAAASFGGFVLFFSTESAGRIATPVFLKGAAVSVGYSQDGRRLMAAGEKEVRVLDASTHEAIMAGSFFSGTHIVAALSADGAFVAVVGAEDDDPASPTSLKLIRVVDREVVTTVVAPATKTLQFASDGKALLFAEAMLSLPSLVPESDIAFSGSAPVLSPDGAFIATDQGVYARATGQVVRPRASYHADSQVFSPDGRLLAELGSGDLHVIDTSSWTEVKTAVLGQATNFAALDWLFFSSDGQHLLLAIPRNAQHLTGDIVVFEEVSASTLKSERFLSDVAFNPAAVFSPDASLVTDGGGVWRTSDLSLVSHLADMTLGAFVQDGRLVAFDRAYDPQTGKRVATWAGPLAGVSPDGTLAVTLSRSDPTGEDVIRVADQSIVSHVDAFAVSGWIFSNDNQYVASQAAEAKDGIHARVFEVATGKLVAKLSEAVGVDIGLTGLGTGAGAVAAFTSGGLRQWSLPEGTVLRDIIGPGQKVAFSPDGALLAVAGTAATRVFDTITGVLRETLPTPTRSPEGTELGLAYARNGNIATVDAEQGVLRLWCSP